MVVIVVLNKPKGDLIGTEKRKHQSSGPVRSISTKGMQFIPEQNMTESINSREVDLVVEVV